MSGKVDAVKWRVSDGVLSTAFNTEDSSLFGFVSVKIDDIEDVTMGVRGTSDLIKLLNMMDSDFKLKVNLASNSTPTGLTMKGRLLTIKYALSELSVIPDPPRKENMPEWDFSMTLDSETLDNVVKSIPAVNNNNFTVVNDMRTGKTEVVIGYDSTANTHRVNMKVESKFDVKPPPFDVMSFSADYLREIILANREADEMVIKISKHGIACIEYDLLDFKAEYYLTKQADE